MGCHSWCKWPICIIWPNSLFLWIALCNGLNESLKIKWNKLWHTSCGLYSVLHTAVSFLYVQLFVCPSKSFSFMLSVNSKILSQKLKYWKIIVNIYLEKKDNWAFMNFLDKNQWIFSLTQHDQGNYKGFEMVLTKYI